MLVVIVTGKLLFSLHYDTKVATIRVTRTCHNNIITARHGAVITLDKTSAPYRTDRMEEVSEPLYGGSVLEGSP